MNVLLISTYELGRQPFGLASPAAWLRREGHRVLANDIAIDDLDEEAVREADFIGIHLPMHTATRLAAAALPRIRALNREAPIAAYGMYAPLNREYLRGLGVEIFIGGEFEPALAEAVRTGNRVDTVSLERLRFVPPDRAGLPPLDRYARLRTGSGVDRIVGYTEASRGCKHRCRHCPVVPVYDGRFRVVDTDVVLQDVRNQVAAGARHITFGDPDFWNAPGHAMPLVASMKAEFPDLTYDVTIKVEHLLRHARHLPDLRETGCLFVTSAVESIDDAVLARLEKGHSAADFERAARLCRAAGVTLAPTFVTFTPWTTAGGFLRLLERLEALELVHEVASIQLAIRLLIPAGSRLLELDEVSSLIGDFDPSALSWSWTHPDPAVDRLYEGVRERVRTGEESGEGRGEIFRAVRDLARRANGLGEGEPAVAPPRAPVPYLTEPWYC